MCRWHHPASFKEKEKNSSSEDEEKVDQDKEEKLWSHLTKSKKKVSVLNFVTKNESHLE